MKPYDSEFGDIDLPNKIFCPNCNSENTDIRQAFIEGFALPRWQVYCKDCLKVGPHEESLTEAIISWNREVAGE